MRRIILGAITGALLLTGSACGTKSEPAAAPAAPTATAAASPSADYTADTKKVCDEAKTVLGGKKMEAFGVEIGKAIAYKQAKATAAEKKARTDAGAKLKDLAKAMSGPTAAAADPKLKAAGEEVVQRMTRSADDEAFIAKFKSVKDINTVLEAEMTEWLAPMETFCS